VEKITVSTDRPCGCSTRYTSVLAFGMARVIDGEAEKAALLTLLVERFAAGQPVQRVTEKDAVGVAVVEIDIDKISGKQNVDPE
jgi:nitroimidazol reductase NimA-like FMN-containing flavoprotein (pyridoxamine 5'-phosphate oxidase superfamily)